MKLLVVNGPNLSRLDIRDSSIYGDLNYGELKSMIEIDTMKKAASRQSSKKLKSIIEIDKMEKAASRQSSTKLKSIIEIDKVEQAASRKSSTKLKSIRWKKQQVDEINNRNR